MLYLLYPQVQLSQMEGGDKNSDFLSFSRICRPLQASLDWLRYMFCTAKQTDEWAEGRE